MTVNADDAIDVQLRLLRRHGIACDTILRVPRDGCGLGAAMAVAGAPQVWVEGAERCRIEPRSGRWALINGCITLVCAVNGARVAVADQRTLAAGDLIEIGLLQFRFEVIVREDSARRGGNSPPQKRDEPVGPEFQWQDLAMTSLPGEAIPGRQADPFGVLRLRDEPWHGPRGGRVRIGGDVAADDDPDPAASLMATLNDEFGRVVRDPHRLAGSVEWPEPVASDRVEAPTLAQLSELGSDFALVRDILQPRQDVGAMIDRFNSSGENDLFRMPSNGDVLRLFAPEVDVEPASALPGLTRREHHAAALDSHLRLGAARQASESEHGGFALSPSAGRPGADEKNASIPPPAHAP